MRISVLMNFRMNKFSHFIFFSGTSVDKSLSRNTSGLWHRALVSIASCFIHFILQLQLSGFPSRWSSSNWLKIGWRVPSRVLKLHPRKLSTFRLTSAFSSSTALTPKACGWICDKFLEASNVKRRNWGNPYREYSSTLPRCGRS